MALALPASESGRVIASARSAKTMLAIKTSV